MRDKLADLPTSLKIEHLQKVAQYREQLKKEPELRNLFLEMTIRCNQYCRHCGSNCGDVIDRGGLSDLEILRCMIRLQKRLRKEQKKLPFLSITGGEPMLRPGLSELMKTIHELGYHWGMTSNGTLIDREAAYALKDAGMYSIGLSIDGMEETHNKFRKSRDGYRKTMDAFRYLTEAGIPKVMITTVVYPENYDELEDIYQVMKSIGCKIWRVINVEPIGRALADSGLLLSEEQYQGMFRFIVSHQDDPDMQVIYSCNHYLGPELERKVRPWYYMCRAGITVASIQYNGDITACLDIERRPELVFGNIRTDEFYDVWTEKFQVFRRDKTDTCDMCKACDHVSFCDGGGFHTWNFDRNRPQICMMEKLRKRG